MRRRTPLLYAIAGIGVACAAFPDRSLAAPRLLRIPVARPGNVTVARVTLTPRGAAATPKLTIANAQTLGPDVAVLTSTEPESRRAKGGERGSATKPRKRKVNLIIVHRHRGRSRRLESFDLAGAPVATARVVLVRLPSDYVSTKPLLAANVVQDNPPPPFECTPTAPAKSLYVGGALRRASVRSLGSSACLLALDRPAPVGAISTFGGDYCSIATAPAGGGGLEIAVTVSCSFGGLNFVELDFGSGLTVLAQLPFAGAQCRSSASIQDCAFPNGIAKSTTYRERILLDRRPPPGRELTLRGSGDGGRTFPYRFSGRFPQKATPGG